VVERRGSTSATSYSLTPGPPDEEQVAPTSNRLTWECREEQFDWAHIFHRSLYDLRERQVIDKEARVPEAAAAISRSQRRSPHIVSTISGAVELRRVPETVSRSVGKSTRIFWPITGCRRDLRLAAPRDLKRHQKLSRGHRLLSWLSAPARPSMAFHADEARAAPTSPTISRGGDDLLHLHMLHTTSTHPGVGRPDLFPTTGRQSNCDPQDPADLSSIALTAPAIVTLLHGPGGHGGCRDGMGLEPCRLCTRSAGRPRQRPAATAPKAPHAEQK